MVSWGVIIVWHNIKMALYILEKSIFARQVEKHVIYVMKRLLIIYFLSKISICIFVFYLFWFTTIDMYTSNGNKNWYILSNLFCTYMLFRVHIFLYFTKYYTTMWFYYIDECLVYRNLSEIYYVDILDWSQQVNSI